MSELIKKLEAATEGSRELDALIQRSIAGNPSDHWFECNGEFVTDDKAPHYTTSIDAALTLVPEGWSWFVEKIDARAKDDLLPAVHSRHADIWLPGAETRGLSCERFRGSAATPALAICIAALKARETTDE